MLWCKTTINNCNISAKASLMLQNLFPVLILHQFKAYQPLLRLEQYQNNLQVAGLLQTLFL